MAISAIVIIQRLQFAPPIILMKWLRLAWRLWWKALIRRFASVYHESLGLSCNRLRRRAHTIHRVGAARSGASVVTTSPEFTVLAMPFFHWSATNGTKRGPGSAGFINTDLITSLLLHRVAT